MAHERVVDLEPEKVNPPFGKICSVRWLGARAQKLLQTYEPPRSEAHVSP